MSFNVRYDTTKDGDLAWPHRRDHVVSLLRFHTPDIVGLQEPLEHQYDYIRERLPSYDWVGVGRRDGDDAGEFGPIGVDATRFEVRDHDTFWLSETPDRAGSTSWDASWPRMATWVRLRDRTTEKTFYAVNTHFEHRSARAREESARLIRERLPGVVGDSPIVLTGDLNCTETSTPYRTLIDASGSDFRLYDAHYRSENGHHGPTVTFNRFEGDPTEKIDYVFVSDGLRVHQHGVLPDHWDGSPPSDHMPVLVELSLD